MTGNFDFVMEVVVYIENLTGHCGCVNGGCNIYKVKDMVVVSWGCSI